MRIARSPFLIGFLATAPLMLACSGEPKTLDIEIVTGHETDAMTKDPAVTRVLVEGKVDGVTTIEAEAAPGGALDFGEVDGEVPYTFEVTGYDAEGNRVMCGRSYSGIVLNGVSGDTFPVFAQRLGEWARPPGELSRTHTHAPAVAVGERYLFTTGGDHTEDAPESEIYDLFAWAGATDSTFPFAAQTLVSLISKALAIGEQAIWLSDGVFSSPTSMPEGLDSWAEVSGGSVVVGPDDRYFVVGATRPENPTDAVLEISADATGTVHRLSFPRAGAAAAWVLDVGLVVAGGSADGSGVEVLAEEADDFALRGFPPDATVGAGAAATDLGFLLVGGTTAGAPAKTRLLDPKCMLDCTSTSLDEANLDVPLERVAAFKLSSASHTAIAIGDDVDATGTTRTFVIDYFDPSVTEIPLKEPRRGATAVPAPNGTLALVGGVHPDGTKALTVEMFCPE